MGPHLIWGLVVAILVFGQDFKVGIEASKQRIKRTTREVQRIVRQAPPKPKLPTTRQARNDPTDAVWKLYSDTGYGTAFVIGRSLGGHTILVTCAHCVEGQDTGFVLGGGKFGEHIKFKNVSVIARDEANDVAILQAPSLTPYRPITVNQWRAGVEGETVEMAGYGGGVWSQHTAVLLRTERIAVNVPGELAPESWITDDISISGHSGSPVFDNEERLVGLLARSNEEISVIVHARYVRWLLEEIGHDMLIDRRVPIEKLETDSKLEAGEPKDE